MDDSGYESPVKNNEVKFSIEWKGAKSVAYHEIVASKHETLKAALLRRYQKLNVMQRLFWAEVKNHVDVVSVNPITLLCDMLHPGTTVQLKTMENSIYKAQDVKMEKRCFNTRFFIEIDNRDKKESITKLHYNDLRRKDICVVARPGESLKQAIESDGRFKDNINKWELHYGPRGQSPLITEKASSFCDAVFKVDVKKDVLKNKSIPLSDVSSVAENEETSCAPSGTGFPGMKFTTHDAAMAENSEPKSQPPQKEETCCAPSGTGFPSMNFTTHDAAMAENSEPKSQPPQQKGTYTFTWRIDTPVKKMHEEMQGFMRSHAQSVLVPPDKQDNSLKFITKLAGEQFATQHSAARSAWLTKELAPLLDSVGIIRCGTVSATCFLLTSDTVITSYHVIDKILKARRSANPVSHRDIFVDFGYELPGHIPDKSKIMKVLPLLHQNQVYSNSIDPSIDYAILRLERNVDDKIYLGGRVRSGFPESGLVSIIGHPDNREKLDETCVILPWAERARQLRERVWDKEKRCEENPSECRVRIACDESVKCVHMYKVDPGNNRIITYDVGCMFEGSSGSPVFDMCGYIVAMHTGGYPLKENGRKSSLIEFGISFQSIIEHLKEKGRHDVVTKLFPSYSDEDMDIN